jgi:hypothetical protein
MTAARDKVAAVVGAAVGGDVGDGVGGGCAGSGVGDAVGGIGVGRVLSGAGLPFKYCFDVLNRPGAQDGGLCSERFGRLLRFAARWWAVDTKGCMPPCAALPPRKAASCASSCCFSSVSSSPILVTLTKSSCFSALATARSRAFTLLLSCSTFSCCCFSSASLLPIFVTRSKSSALTAAATDCFRASMCCARVAGCLREAAGQFCSWCTTISSNSACRRTLAIAT